MKDTTDILKKFCSQNDLHCSLYGGKSHAATALVYSGGVHIEAKGASQSSAAGQILTVLHKLGVDVYDA